MANIINFVKLCDEAVTPQAGTTDSTGFDLTIISVNKVISAKTKRYGTGIKIEPPVNYYTEIVPRSSLSNSGYILSNSVGIIDYDYRGELLICLTKVDDTLPDLQLPFKCCQLILRRREPVEMKLVDKINDATVRGAGGFGSTDKPELKPDQPNQPENKPVQLGQPNQSLENKNILPVPYTSQSVSYIDAEIRRMTLNELGDFLHQNVIKLPARINMLREYLGPVICQEMFWYTSNPELSSDLPTSPSGLRTDIASADSHQLYYDFVTGIFRLENHNCFSLKDIRNELLSAYNNKRL